jgi:hypothetical protein
MHDFQTFHRSLARHRGEPLVTIQRRGAISLNAAAFAALGSPGGIELLYDVDKRIIGLRAADPRLPHAHIVRASTKSAGGPFVISATAFLHYYDVDRSVAKRWVGFLEDDVLCIDLKTDGVPTGARGGAPRKRD